MDLSRSLHQARKYQKTLARTIKMFAEEAQLHMDIIIGQKICAHQDVDHTKHLGYHHEMMMCCDEHSLSLRPYKRLADDATWTLQDLVWKREGELEDQKIIRILNVIYNQADHEPVTR